MNNETCGLCLIINIEKFEIKKYHALDEMHRSGGYLDALRAKRLFELLHFETRLSKENLQMKELRKEIEMLANDCKKSDYQSLALIIMSHGHKGDTIQTYDNKSIKVSKEFC